VSFEHLDKALADHAGRAEYANSQSVSHCPLR
jgi:hypothetical protein